MTSMLDYIRKNEDILNFFKSNEYTKKILDLII